MGEQKASHSKMSNLFYTQLKMQDYLKCETLTVTEAQIVYSFRTRMAAFSNNYKGSTGVTTCPLCKKHLDVQSLSFQCQKIKENIKIACNYDKIFDNNISQELAKSLVYHTEIVL